MNPDPREGERDPILLQRIEGALESLPEMFRMVVVMHDREGFTHDEIGRTLGIPTGTSKARLSRARALLRPILVRVRRGLRTWLNVDASTGPLLPRRGHGLHRSAVWHSHAPGDVRPCL
jgi:hypothetical protein